MHLFEVGKLAIFKSSHNFFNKNLVFGKIHFSHMKVCYVSCPKGFFNTNIYGDKKFITY